MLTPEHLRILKEQAKRTADKYIDDPSRAIRHKPRLDNLQNRIPAKRKPSVDDDDIPF